MLAGAPDTRHTRSAANVSCLDPGKLAASMASLPLRPFCFPSHLLPLLAQPCLGVLAWGLRSRSSHSYRPNLQLTSDQFPRLALCCWLPITRQHCRETSCKQVHHKSVQFHPPTIYPLCYVECICALTRLFGRCTEGAVRSPARLQKAFAHLSHPVQHAAAA
jgi:hypothetical protein